MKIATFLSFIFVVCVLSAPAVVIVQADEQTAPEFSVSFKMAHDTETKNQRKYEKYSVDENGTGTVLIVYNAMISLLEDNDGDEKYPQMECKLDLDTNETTDFYAIFYLDFGHGWFTFDSLKTDVYTLEEGYSPKEGSLYLDLYFVSGYQDYDPMKISIKVEVYTEDGSLVATYGPDDDPDLKNIPIESAEYDEKDDPFVTPSPTPSPTPTPIPNADEIKLNNSSALEGNRLIIRKGKSISISAEALSGGEAISGAEIKAEADGAVATISPSVATTDENGLAEFTITAKKKGNAKIIFSSGDAKKILRVKVK